MNRADLDSNITIDLGFIGYWNITINCLDYMEDYNGPCAEEFIWQATITQDGYRYWYMESDSLLDVVKKSVDWASERMYISDRDI